MHTQWICDTNSEDHDTWNLYFNFNILLFFPTSQYNIFMLMNKHNWMPFERALVGWAAPYSHKIIISNI